MEEKLNEINEQTSVNTEESSKEQIETENNSVVDENAEKKSDAQTEPTEPQDEKDEKTQKIEELTQKNNELNDKFLRLYSEFENYKKRVARERIELLKTAAEDTILSLLPVYDDFERALKSIEDTEENKALKEGVVLIFNKFKTILSQKGLTEIVVNKGDEFNTDYHEALTQVETGDETLKGKIIEEVQKGFMLSEKVIRYSKVVVGL